jgi:hypothetical protein
LLGSYFVNAASLMYLAAILEKRATGLVCFIGVDESENENENE